MTTTTAPSDFEVKTVRELGRLREEAAVIAARRERRFPGHLCAEGQPGCSECSAYRRKHAELDDHLAQLEAYRLEQALGITPEATHEAP